MLLGSLHDPLHGVNSSLNRSAINAGLQETPRPVGAVPPKVLHSVGGYRRPSHDVSALIEIDAYGFPSVNLDLLTLELKAAMQEITDPGCSPPPP